MPTGVSHGAGIPPAASAYLLTGRPGVGKTSCLRRVLELLGTPAGGFVTEEIREGGRRMGFALVTLDGRRTTLAHVARRGPPRVGQYGVDVHALDAVGVPAIRAALRAGQLTVIDEIGKMEMVAPAFRRAVEDALAAPVVVLATILAAPDPWADRVKRYPATRLVELTVANRGALPRELADLVRGALADARRRGVP